MNAKRKGSRNEHRSILQLDSVGYCCTRAAASLGTFDIIGISATDVVLVQVKSRVWPGSVEMETIRNFPCPQLCKKIITAGATEHAYPDVRTVGTRTLRVRSASAKRRHQRTTATAENSHLSWVRNRFRIRYGAPLTIW